MDVSHYSAAQVDRCRHILQGILHQNYVRRLDGNIRTSADRDADIRAGQRGCIVDSVAHHGDLMPLFLQGPDVGLLFGRQYIRYGLLDAELLADGLRGHPVIACQHHDVQAHLGKLLDRRPAGCTHRIGHGNHSDNLAVPREQKRSLSFLCQLGNGIAGFLRRGILYQKVIFLHERHIASQVCMPADRCTDAAACLRLKRLRFGNRDTGLLGSFHHGLR